MGDLKKHVSKISFPRIIATFLTKTRGLILFFKVLWTEIRKLFMKKLTEYPKNPIFLI